MKVQVPYGTTELEIDIPEENLQGVVQTHMPVPLPDLEEEILRILRSPVGCRPLIEEVRGKKKVCVVITDISRPHCYRVMMPVLLGELARGGIHSEDVTILVGTGLHRPNIGDELVQMLGEEIARGVKVVNHRADHKEDVTYLGETSYGCPVWVNNILLESDYIICTGVLEPHFWAGFSGGRKVIGIGCTGEDTIKFLHSPQLFEDPSIRMGNIEGNKFHQMLTEIAEKAGAQFMLNFIMDEEKRVCALAGGELHKAFEFGVSFAQKVYQAEIDQQADIVIAGVAYPKSTNLYQGTRGASCSVFSPYPTVRRGGMVITPLPAEEGAGKGVGEERFRKLLSGAESIEDFILHCLEYGYPGGAQRAFLLALTMRYAEVVVTDLVDPAAAQELKLTVKPTLRAALDYGFEKYGKKTKILVVPDGARFFTVKRR